MKNESKHRKSIVMKITAIRRKYLFFLVERSISKFLYDLSCESSSVDLLPLISKESNDMESDTNDEKIKRSKLLVIIQI